MASGSLLFAFPVAFAAGLIAFLSPCVLPLAPGYVSYMTGLTGAELADGRKSRLLLGSVLFVLGFSVVFVSFGAFFGGVGSVLLQYQDVITRVLGVVVIIMGLAFMGFIPGLQREWRIHRLPNWGVAGAPIL
ncbi:MAG: cytochrome c biogenesis protein CcdA, partial [Actinomycetes bacterium]